jgi:hypothetical protein
VTLMIREMPSFWSQARFSEDRRFPRYRPSSAVEMRLIEVEVEVEVEGEAGLRGVRADERMRRR